MVTALVMLNVDRKHIRKVSQSLVDMKEVSEVYSVAGRYDLVAIVPGKGVKSDQGLGCRDAFKSRKLHGDRVCDLLIALDTNDCHQIVPSGD